MSENFLILMVEDEVKVMDVNRRMLKRRGYDLKEAKNAHEAYEFLKDKIPDLLILDIMLPDGDGYDICSYFREKSDNPVIFLTGKTEIKDKVKGLSQGCDYYLTKPYNFEELLAVVQRLLKKVERRKDFYEEKSKIKVGGLVLDLLEAKAFVGNEDICLTKTEFSMLKIFMDYKNKELSSEELYKLVWGKNPIGDTRNVRKHIMNIRNKIRAEESNDYDIVTSYGKGYTFIEY